VAATANTSPVGKCQRVAGRIRSKWAQILKAPKEDGFHVICLETISQMQRPTEPSKAAHPKMPQTLGKPKKPASVPSFFLFSVSPHTPRLPAPLDPCPGRLL
jgi:hypothetical protein